MSILRIVVKHKLTCGGFAVEFAEDGARERIGLGLAVFPGGVDTGVAAVGDGVEWHFVGGVWEMCDV